MLSDDKNASEPQQSESANKDGLEGFPADAEPSAEQAEQAKPVPDAEVTAPAQAAEHAGAAAPAVTEEAHDAKAAAEANPDTPREGCFRILVVEDARILRKMLVKILHDAGHICDEAAQGHEAMAYLRRSKAMNQPYDLVITDLMMPEMDGWGLIDAMTEKKFFPALPVVIITANATLESVKRSGKLGIKNFVVKPFESVRVLETVKKAIQRHRGG